MPKPKLSHEEKQVRRIVERWTRLQVWHLFLASIGMALVFFLMRSHIDLQPFPALFLILVFGAPLVFHWIRREKTFLQKLSREELSLLQAVADSDRAESDKIRMSAGGILKAYEGYTVNEEKELLRASHPTQETASLLRPASANPETPKEELLRAAQGMNNEKQ